MRAWWKWLAWAVWLAGTATAWWLGPGGTLSEPVELRLADGTPIRGTYYSPHPRWNVQPAVVVVHGTAAGHRSCALGLSLPLARNGFHVLAIDLRGHGDSGGSLPRAEFGNVNELLATRGDHPEIHAAIEHLKSRPNVDPSRLALVGHSRGGWAATNVAQERTDVRSVVAIGVAPQTCDLDAPQNYLILAGGKDLLSAVPACIQAMAAATGGVIRTPDTPFGDWKQGTARRWVVVTRVGHLSELADPAVSRRTVQWICSSIDLDAGPVPGKRLVWSLVALLLATLGGMLGVAGVLSSRFLIPRSVPVPWAGVTMHRTWATVLFLMLVTLAAPLAAAVSRGFLFPTVFGLEGALCLLAFVGLSAFVGAVIAGRTEAEKHVSVLRQLGLGGLAFVLIILGVGVPWGLTWADLVPTGKRLLLGLALVPLILPLAWVLATGRGRITRGLGSLPRHHSIRLVLWLALPLLLCLSHTLFLADVRPLFLVPVWLISAGMLAVVPISSLSAWREFSLARALVHALITAWLLACHLPFVHE